MIFVSCVTNFIGNATFESLVLPIIEKIYLFSTHYQHLACNILQYSIRLHMAARSPIPLICLPAYRRSKQMSNAVSIESRPDLFGHSINNPYN